MPMLWSLGMDLLRGHLLKVRRLYLCHDSSNNRPRILQQFQCLCQPPRLPQQSFLPIPGVCITRAFSSFDTSQLNRRPQHVCSKHAKRTLACDVTCLLCTINSTGSILGHLGPRMLLDEIPRTRHKSNRPCDKLV